MFAFIQVLGSSAELTSRVQHVVSQCCNYHTRRQNTVQVYIYIEREKKPLSLRSYKGLALFLWILAMPLVSSIGSIYFDGFVDSQDK